MFKAHSSVLPGLVVREDSILEQLHEVGLATGKDGVHAFSPVRRDSPENRFFSPVTMKLMPTAATMSAIIYAPREAAVIAHEGVRYRAGRPHG
jgi:hypothetical protein